MNLEGKKEKDEWWVFSKVDNSEITWDKLVPVVYGNRTHFSNKYYHNSNPIINIKNEDI